MAHGVQMLTHGNAMNPIASSSGCLQAPSAVLMIRPAAFCPNVETAVDNAYQVDAPLDAVNRAVIANAAITEVETVARVLQSMGVVVILLDDLPDVSPPDSVFPNNWISTHFDRGAGSGSGASGTIVVYPMANPSRRRERRQDVINLLNERYGAAGPTFDLTHLEHEGVFLEGTGALVLDHVNKVAYMAKSGRGHEVALHRWCEYMGYDMEAFDTRDPATGRAIYHTNVMLSIATEFAVICIECITSLSEASRVSQRLEQTGHKLVLITSAQVAEFAGNGLEITTLPANPDGSGNRIFAMSARAAASLTQQQVREIERYARIVSIPVPTIELAGGSLRCMLAGIHLPAAAAAAARERSAEGEEEGKRPPVCGGSAVRAEYT